MSSLLKFCFIFAACRSHPAHLHSNWATQAVRAHNSVPSSFCSRTPEVQGHLKLLSATWGCTGRLLTVPVADEGGGVLHATQGLEQPPWCGMLEGVMHAVAMLLCSTLSGRSLWCGRFETL